MQLGDRLVCTFIHPLKIGATFKKWPLHVTIVPWFRLDDSSRQISDGLKRALTKVVPFEAKAGEEVRFGPRKNRPANLLLDSPFTHVEQRTRSYLHKKRAWLVDETTKKKREYRPHVTFQDEERLLEGGTLFCDRIYIVEQLGSHKKVVGRIELGQQGSW